jgi:hypothetical protein
MRNPQSSAGQARVWAGQAKRSVAVRRAAARSGAARATWPTKVSPPGGGFPGAQHPPGAGGLLHKLLSRRRLPHAPSSAVHVWRPHRPSVRRGEEVIIVRDLAPGGEGAVAPAAAALPPQQARRPGPAGAHSGPGRVCCPQAAWEGFGPLCVIHRREPARRPDTGLSAPRWLGEFTRQATEHARACIPAEGLVIEPPGTQRVLQA